MADNFYASYPVAGGGGTDVTIGAFGSTPNDDGLTIDVNQVINMEPADETHPGGISITDQSFAGVKTFANGLITQQIFTPDVVGVGNSDNIDIRTGATDLGTSGQLNMGTGNSSNGSSGDINLKSGSVIGLGLSGSVTIGSGPSDTTTGPLSLLTGDTPGGNSGSLGISTGTANGVGFSSGGLDFTTGVGDIGSGAINLRSGPVNNGSSGNVESSTGVVVDGTSGDWNLRTGAPSGDGSSGTIRIITGPTIGIGNSGDIVVSSGAADVSDTGSVSLRSGSTAGSISGSVIVTSGSANAISGNLELSAGSANERGTVNLSAGVHFTSSGDTPTIAAEAAAGSGATADVTGATDVRGEIVLTTGTGAGIGDVVTLTFVVAYGSDPIVVFSPSNPAAALIRFNVRVGVASFTILTDTDGLDDDVEYRWMYHVIG